MPASKDFQPALCYDLTTLITNGTAQSLAVDLLGTEVVGFFTPGTFEGTTLTFQVSTAIGGTYVNLQSGGADYSIAGIAANKYVALDPSIFAGVRFLKITISVGGNVGADRTLTLATRPVRKFPRFWL
jgi:hypothetical protein